MDDTLRRMNEMARDPYGIGQRLGPNEYVGRQLERHDPEEAVKLAEKAVTILLANRDLNNDRIAEVADGLLRRAKSLLGLHEKTTP